ncbi:MAG TPA: T9SS type A sorting domain-containing protein, partial [Bacteroidetes bacterium]|nr:T9SS type A sorting domain-containing protein [Bacteroidota bacterium]
KNVIATLCEDSGDTTNTYLANFDFEVPKGFKGCRDDDNLFTWSDEVAIVLESFEIDESDPDHDLIDVAILLTPPAGYDFVTEGATGIITLCDSTGNMICRQFNIEAQTCDACQPEVTSVASCADTNPNDDVFVYEGSVTVTILGGSNIATCGVISQEVGFSVSYSQIGNDWTINYSITTSEEGFTQTSALLCFYHQVDQTKTCIPLTITVESPCPPPFPPLPTDCVANWDPKEMTCTGEGEGNVIFHIPNMSVTGAPYSLCEEGLFGTVDGGSGGQVVVNSASFYGGVLFFDINILIPSQNFVSGQVYDVRLYLCDIFGNPVCYLFPYTLTCGGDGGTGGRPLGEFNPNGPISTYSILPNPATDKLIVISDQFDNEKEQEIRLFDHLGRLVKAAYLLSGKQEINVTDLHRGIYFVAILEGGLLVKVEKVAIIR